MKKIKFKTTLFFSSILLLALILVACGPAATPAPTDEPAPTDPPAAVEEPAEPTATTALEEQSDEANDTLRMALLPVLDVLPFFIAQEQGYFEEEGVTVVFLPVSSALEREQLFVAGEADGMLTDVIGPAITNANAAEGSTVKIVATARQVVEDGPLFRLLASPGSEVTSPEDLAGVAIGVSENSVIQYLGDRLLEDAGLTPDQIVYESVPSIPNRFGLMMEGQLGAAILPDPLAQAAIEAGAILVLEDTIVVEDELSQSVLSFSTIVLEEKPEAVQAFLRAWNRAVEDLNTDSDSFRQLWLDSTNVPESVQDTYVIPPFPQGAITSEAVWDDVNEWLIGREIIDEAASYESSVTVEYLTE
ncbi:ABC transporter substrate-binding protein [Chloroflexota bacterium]